MTEADLTGLPDPVAGYIRRSGAVGRPRVCSFYAKVHGRSRSGPDKPWMIFTGRQLNTYGEIPQRLFYLEATMYGLPVTVFHVLDANAATMRGKVVSLLPILDAKGAAMDRSETVTLFNDMVVLAPAALVDAPVVWTEDSPSRVRATYTRAAETVNADLIFDSSGDLVDLVSHDRSRASSDGTSFTLQPWNTPITDYRRVPWTAGRGRRNRHVGGSSTGGSLHVHRVQHRRLGLQRHRPHRYRHPTIRGRSGSG